MCGVSGGETVLLIDHRSVRSAARPTKAAAMPGAATIPAAATSIAAGESMRLAARPARLSSGEVPAPHTGEQTSQHCSERRCAVWQSSALCVAVRGAEEVDERRCASSRGVQLAGERDLYHTQRTESARVHGVVHCAWPVRVTICAVDALSETMTLY